MRAVHISREQWIIAGVCGLFLVALVMVSWDAFVFYRAAEITVTAGDTAVREGKTFERDIDAVIKLLDDRAAQFARLTAPRSSPLAATTTPPQATR